MKNNHIFIYALLMLSLAACSSAKFNGVNNVDDDVYWSSKDEPKSGGKNIKDVEPWNKNKGPNPSSYEPVEQNTSASSDQSYINLEEERGRNAYQAWQNRTNAKMAEDTSKQNNVWVSNSDNERDARRFGSDRNYYYDDPYYNVLSNNWGWTSFYNPIVRPGFYNWAPGWNVGLSWNSYNGFGVNMGYNMGWGGMGYGFNPWNGPQYGGFILLIMTHFISLFITHIMDMVVFMTHTDIHMVITTLMPMETGGDIAIITIGMVDIMEDMMWLQTDQS